MSVFVSGHSLLSSHPSIRLGQFWAFCECGWQGPLPDHAQHAADAIGGGPLLRARLEWEAEHPRPESLRRAERAIVRALAAEFGPGQQHQVTTEAGFDIAIEDVLIHVELAPDAQTTTTTQEDT